MLIGSGWPNAADYAGQALRWLHGICVLTRVPLGTESAIGDATLIFPDRLCASTRTLSFPDFVGVHFIRPNRFNVANDVHANLFPTLDYNSELLR